MCYLPCPPLAPPFVTEALETSLELNKPSLLPHCSRKGHFFDICIELPGNYHLIE